MSPKLFKATLESIFRRLSWKTRGVRIDGKYLSSSLDRTHTLLCANSPYELQQMLQELPDKSENQDLTMKKSKTNNIMENYIPIYVNITHIGQRYSSRETQPR